MSRLIQRLYLNSSLHVISSHLRPYTFHNIQVIFSCSNLNKQLTHIHNERIRTFRTTTKTALNCQPWQVIKYNHMFTAVKFNIINIILLYHICIRWCDTIIRVCRYFQCCLCRFSTHCYWHCCVRIKARWGFSYILHCLNWCKA